ncbi:MAG: alpha/beta fold hydrolase [Actinomadura sp.]
MTELYVHEWGTGDRVAVLVHGITSDHGSWWRFGPELADRGYHVYAPHLRGHGHSPRGPYSARAWADDLVKAVPAKPELAVGHSLGGLVLALAADRLRPRRAVYEDPAWTLPATGGGQETAASFRAQHTWTLEQIRAFYPRWEPPAWEAKLAAVRRWDPATTEFVTSGFGRYDPAPPTAPAMLMLADPSTLIVPERADELERAGFEVRVVKGAGHVIHNDDYPGFLEALDDWI